MNWSDAALITVRGGMHDVIMAPDGTGRRAAVDGLDFAGKTGTAEFGVRGEGSKHTWMIAFAPFDNPQYAVAMLIEEGDSGGQTVGPCLKVLMEGLRDKLKREGRLGFNAPRLENPSPCVVFKPLEFEHGLLRIEPFVQREVLS
jgi:cell division protein FtsI/penicillin-binding protein 2